MLVHLINSDWLFREGLTVLLKEILIEFLTMSNTQQYNERTTQNVTNLIRSNKFEPGNDILKHFPNIFGFNIRLFEITKEGSKCTTFRPNLETNSLRVMKASSLWKFYNSLY